jgi:hypothetical protein
MIRSFHENYINLNSKLEYLTWFMTKIFEEAENKIDLTNNDIKVFYFFLL